jgi:crotonobetainyl-CoA:carnitine CoA-transferase CaiB-like acyl-CoA transferase
VVAWDIADLAGDPALSTAAGRFARREEIDARLAEWCTHLTAEAGAAALQAAGVPAGKVQDGADLTNDPQLVARNFWRSTDHAVFGPRPYDRFPALWSGTDLEPYVLSGAYIGEDNFDVYRELVGLDDETIGERMGDGLFG